jgi:predicted acetyltransferase
VRTPQLIQPRDDLEASHRSFVAEFVAGGESVVPWIAAVSCETFSGYVAMLKDAANGIGLREGHVPHLTFWLVMNDEILGVSNLRHRVNERLLRDGGHIGFGIRPSARRKGYGAHLLGATLLEAGKLGLGRLLLTCDRNNVASARTIIRNGGELDSEEFIPERNRVISRYWIQN